MLTSCSLYMCYLWCRWPSDC